MGLSFSYRIVRHLGTLTTKGKRLKSLNLISYDGRPPVYDLRTWEATEKGPRMGKGITLSGKELTALRDLLNKLTEEIKANREIERQVINGLNGNYPIESKRGIGEDNDSSRPGGGAAP